MADNTSFYLCHPAELNSLRPLQPGTGADPLAHVMRSPFEYERIGHCQSMLKCVSEDCWQSGGLTHESSSQERSEHRAGKATAVVVRSFPKFNTEDYGNGNFGHRAR
jgi:hypothetical protein